MRLIKMAVLSLSLIVASAVGIAGLVCVGVFAFFVLIFGGMAWEAANVQAAAEQLQRDPIVQNVEYELDGFLGNYLYVELQPVATDADAKAIWCDVILSRGIGDTAEVVDSKWRSLQQPPDCRGRFELPEPRGR